MAGAIIIRPIGEDERAAWNPLWDGYLAFYKTALTQDVSVSPGRGFTIPMR